MPTIFGRAVARERGKVCEKVDIPYGFASLKGDREGGCQMGAIRPVGNATIEKIKAEPSAEPQSL
ncbi:hypothetical protein [Bradyrhizobium vignae]|uniref:hypothetical protein n=1 Tax=Bradyrhizobium vignae TaxID=1549949 RepID=UPI00100A9247|nr:hypothetical protein [Bradyrhizobium vignae]RXH06670.1 hypothetical protein EAV90_02305 [Bradyrhizobium vignae]